METKTKKQQVNESIMDYLVNEKAAGNEYVLNIFYTVNGDTLPMELGSPLDYVDNRCYEDRIAAKLNCKLFMKISNSQAGMPLNTHGNSTIFKILI